LFIFSAGLAYFRYYIHQPGQIVLRLQPADTREYINLGLKFQSQGTTHIDTVTAPGELDGRPAGQYHFETIDADIASHSADIVLEPMASETLYIPVHLKIKTLTVETEPSGAEIWIDGFQASSTPDTFEVLNRDTVVLELKMKGYQTYSDTVNLAENLDLGVIVLDKLYKLRVSCLYQDMAYNIYDMNDRIVFSARGSRTLQLPQGRYKVAYERGEGQYDTKGFVLKRNYTLTVP
jgi:hypothetical protein